MDKKLEDEIRKHLSDSIIERERFLKKIDENSNAIYGLIRDVGIIKSEQKIIKETVQPIHDFFVTMESVGRVGRIVRAIVGWLVLVLGTLTVVYVTVKGSVTGK